MTHGAAVPLNDQTWLLSASMSESQVKLAVTGLQSSRVTNEISRISVTPSRQVSS